MKKCFYVRNNFFFSSQQFTETRKEILGRFLNLQFRRHTWRRPFALDVAIQSCRLFIFTFFFLFYFLIHNFAVKLPSNPLTTMSLGKKIFLFYEWMHDAHSRILSRKIQPRVKIYSQHSNNFQSLKKIFENFFSRSFFRWEIT